MNITVEYAQIPTGIASVSPMEVVCRLVGQTVPLNCVYTYEHGTMHILDAPVPIVWHENEEEERFETNVFRLGMGAFLSVEHEGYKFLLEYRNCFRTHESDHFVTFRVKENTSLLRRI